MATTEKQALSRISPRVTVWVSVSIVYRIATEGYSWIWPKNTYGQPSVCQLTPLMHEWRDRPIFLNTTLYQRDINEAATYNRQDSGNLVKGFQGQRLKVKVLQGQL